MGNYYRQPTYPKARKEHACIACLHPIAVGEKYTQQTGFHEGEAFRNHYHDECWNELSELDEFEFSPGDVDPPERVRLMAQ